MTILGTAGAALDSFAMANELTTLITTGEFSFLSDDNAAVMDAIAGLSNQITSQLSSLQATLIDTARKDALLGHVAEATTAVDALKVFRAYGALTDDSRNSIVELSNRAFNNIMDLADKIMSEDPRPEMIIQLLSTVNYVSAVKYQAIAAVENGAFGFSGNSEKLERASAFMASAEAILLDSINVRSGAQLFEQANQNGVWFIELRGNRLTADVDVSVYKADLLRSMGLTENINVRNGPAFNIELARLPQDEATQTTWAALRGGPYTEVLLNRYLKLALEEAVLRGEGLKPVISGASVAASGLRLVLDGEEFIGKQGGDILQGTPGNDFMSGLAGADVLFGLGDADVLLGGSGLDQLFGGGGNDTLVGGDDDDFLLGQADDDNLDGGDGDDVLTGDDGEDTIDGGLGDDSIDGGDGADVADGGDGDDSIFGGEGNDDLNGGDGRDTLDGADGNDVLYGSRGDDSIVGGDGKDTLRGSSGDDVLQGGEGNDELYGGHGNDLLQGGSPSGSSKDTLNGGQGNDTLEGGGQDFLFGGDGDDLLRVLSLSENYTEGVVPSARVYGQAGFDTLDLTLFRYVDVVVTATDADGGNTGYVDFTSGPGIDIPFSRLAFQGIELVLTVNDSLQGDDGDNTIEGGIGNDTLVGAGGNDLLDGGADDDVLSGGLGDDTLIGGDGQDAVFIQAQSTAITGRLDEVAGTLEITSEDGTDVIHDDVEEFYFSDMDLSYAQVLALLVNAAPTAVVLQNADTSLDENTDTTSRIKMADIEVTDDLLGSNELGLAGADAELFEIDGTELFLRQGTALNFEAQSQLNVTVTVDDPTVGATPDASATLSVTVDDQDDDPTGTIEITGDPVEAATLTVVSTLEDEDGLGTLMYQWLRDGTPIAGATGATYEVANADVGAVVSVRVTYDDDNGAQFSLVSGQTETIGEFVPPPVGSVAIAGDPIEGASLMAMPSVPNGVDPGTISYQWLRDGAPIAGATSDTCPLEQADVGAVLSVQMSYTDPLGAAVSVASGATTPIGNVNDAPTGAVTIAGDLTEDATLTAASSLADEDGIGTLAYQWLRDGAPITGATADTYVLGQADVGTAMSVQVSYTDDQGTEESVTSGATAPVGNLNDDPSGTVTISGSAREGETLMAVSTLNDDDGLGPLSYQWLRDGTAIAGATAAGYVLDVTDVGRQLSVMVSYTDGQGAAESVTTAVDSLIISRNFQEGTAGDDVLTGLNGNDTLVGLGGDDTLRGGVGDDRLIGGAGSDRLIGGDGADVAVLAVSSTVVTVEAGDGGLIVTYAEGPQDVPNIVSDFVSDDTETVQFGDGNLTYAEVAGLIVPNATPGNDLIEGLSVADTVDGLGGDDTIRGNGGDDSIQGGDGNDRITGGIGNDTIDGGNGVDTLDGGDGNDQLTGGSTDVDLRDVIFGGAGDDTIEGGYGNDELRGDAGNDSIAGGFGADTVIGGSGNDTLTGSAFGDLIFGGDGMDFLNGGFGSDRVNGGADADQFFHLGVFDHGSDWIQDYSFADGDVLVFGGAATVTDFQVNQNTTAGAGGDATEEAFVIYRPTDQILWALVDGMDNANITLRIAGTDYDLLP
ncbi:hypothetical protein [Jannaschia sp. M317]|uniref:hypothetical protein n=1 Tax=Jannaschia sp. M317 TaxID=2867011 RepID=UPI0021A5B932|nr:hypothetical protein [Jannaschia sp. M317]UWQ19301.1 hypothetical protein K3551_08565 [Jannaschia sp. M317]